MSNKSRRKGFAYEREIVNLAKEYGFESKRAWGSNGQAMGEHKEVDILIGELRVQAKRRKKFPEYLHLPDECDIVVLREDFGTSKVVIDLDKFLTILKKSVDNS